MRAMRDSIQLLYLRLLPSFSKKAQSMEGQDLLTGPLEGYSKVGISAFREIVYHVLPLVPLIHLDEGAAFEDLFCCFPIPFALTTSAMIISSSAKRFPSMITATISRVSPLSPVHNSLKRRWS
jgi:hypothetical protein